MQQNLDVNNSEMQGKIEKGSIRTASLITFPNVLSLRDNLKVRRGRQKSRQKNSNRFPASLLLSTTVSSTGQSVDCENATSTTCQFSSSGIYSEDGTDVDTTEDLLNASNATIRGEEEQTPVYSTSPTIGENQKHNSVQVDQKVWMSGRRSSPPQLRDKTLLSRTKSIIYWLEKKLEMYHLNKPDFVDLLQPKMRSKLFETALFSTNSESLQGTSQSCDEHPPSPKCNGQQAGRFFGENKIKALSQYSRSASQDISLKENPLPTALPVPKSDHSQITGAGCQATFVDTGVKDQSKPHIFIAAKPIIASRCFNQVKRQQIRTAASENVVAINSVIYQVCQNALYATLSGGKATKHVVEHRLCQPSITRTGDSSWLPGGRGFGSAVLRFSKAELCAMNPGGQLPPPPPNPINQQRKDWLALTEIATCIGSSQHTPVIEEDAWGIFNLPCTNYLLSEWSLNLTLGVFGMLPYSATIAKNSIKKVISQEENIFLCKLCNPFSFGSLSDVEISTLLVSECLVDVSLDTNEVQSPQIAVDTPTLMSSRQQNVSTDHMLDQESLQNSLIGEIQTPRMKSHLSAPSLFLGENEKTLPMEPGPRKPTNEWSESDLMALSSSIGVLVEASVSPTLNSRKKRSRKNGSSLINSIATQTYEEVVGSYTDENSLQMNPLTDQRGTSHNKEGRKKVGKRTQRVQTCDELEIQSYEKQTNALIEQLSLFPTTEEPRKLQNDRSGHHKSPDIEDTSTINPMRYTTSVRVLLERYEELTKELLESKRSLALLRAKQSQPTRTDSIPRESATANLGNSQKSTAGALVRELTQQSVTESRVREASEFEASQIQGADLKPNLKINQLMNFAQIAPTNLKETISHELKISGLEEVAANEGTLTIQPLSANHTTNSIFANLPLPAPMIVPFSTDPMSYDSPIRPRPPTINWASLYFQPDRRDTITTSSRQNTSTESTPAIADIGQYAALINPSFENSKPPNKLSQTDSLQCHHKVTQGKNYGESSWLLHRSRSRLDRQKRSLAAQKHYRSLHSCHQRDESCCTSGSGRYRCRGSASCSHRSRSRRKSHIFDGHHTAHWPHHPGEYPPPGYYDYQQYPGGMRPLGYPAPYLSPGGLPPWAVYGMPTGGHIGPGVDIPHAPVPFPCPQQHQHHSQNHLPGRNFPCSHYLNQHCSGVSCASHCRPCPGRMTTSNITSHDSCRSTGSSSILNEAPPPPPHQHTPPTYLAAQRGHNKTIPEGIRVSGHMGSEPQLGSRFMPYGEPMSYRGQLARPSGMAPTSNCSGLYHQGAATGGVYRPPHASHLHTMNSGAQQPTVKDLMRQLPVERSIPEKPSMEYSASHSVEAERTGRVDQGASRPVGDLAASNVLPEEPVKLPQQENHHHNNQWQKTYSGNNQIEGESKTAIATVARRAMLSGEPVTVEDWKHVEQRHDVLQRQKTLLETQLSHLPRVGVAKNRNVMIEEERLTTTMTQLDRELSALRMLLRKRNALKRGLSTPKNI